MSVQVYQYDRVSSFLFKPIIVCIDKTSNLFDSILVQNTFYAEIFLLFLLILKNLKIIAYFLT